jgi:rod shape-determining protein MreC
VLLIDDQNATLDALDQRSRVPGVVAGVVDGGLTMKVAPYGLAAAARSDSSREGKILGNQVSGIVEQLKAQLLTVNQARAQLRALTENFGRYIRTGDALVTSGFDGTFPRGVLIGQVSRVDIDSQGSGLFVNVSVAPAVDFRRLEQVQVLTEPAPRVRGQLPQSVN